MSDNDKTTKDRIPQDREFLGTIDFNLPAFDWAKLVARITKAVGGTSTAEDYQKIAVERGATFTEEQIAELLAICPGTH